MQPSVYLSGPMRGLSFDQADEWRRYATEALWPDVVTYSPMRGKDHLRGAPIPTHTAHPLSRPEGIVARDYYDTLTTDMLLVNVLGAKEVSQGTVAEIAWAYAHRKPVLLVMEHMGNPHDHPMNTVPAGWRVDDLDDALDIVRAVLLPDRPDIGSPYDQWTPEAGPTPEERELGEVVHTDQGERVIPVTPLQALREEIKDAVDVTSFIYSKDPFTEVPYRYRGRGA